MEPAIPCEGANWAVCRLLQGVRVRAVNIKHPIRAFGETPIQSSDRAPLKIVLALRNGAVRTPKQHARNTNGVLLALARLAFITPQATLKQSFTLVMAFTKIVRRAILADGAHWAPPNSAVCT
jgi:hypothetical protein